MNSEMMDLEDPDENINEKDETDILQFNNLDDENFINELLDDNSVDELFLRDFLEDFDIDEELWDGIDGQEAEKDTHDNLKEDSPPGIFDNSNNTKKFPCTFCAKSFPDKRYLNRHLHKHTGKFTCTTCKKAFARKESLIKHVNRNRCKGLKSEIRVTKTRIFKTDPNNFCTICDKQFTRKANFKEHMERHDGFRIVCENCGKIYTSYRSFLRHRIVHNCKTIHICPNCIKPFFFKSSFSRHISRCDKNNVEVVCKKCNYKLKSDAMIKKHENEEPKECVLCSKIFCLAAFKNEKDEVITNLLISFTGN